MKVELKVISGPHEGQAFQFDSHDTFLVGRGPQAHFRLPKKDSFFSRLHFMVEVNPPHCRLTDLESTNGTLVNNHRVEQADLKNGDILRGGKTQIRVRIQDDDIRATRRQVAPPPGSIDTSGEGPKVAEAIKSETPVPTPASVSPLEIGPYQVEREIGRGGMGVVYLARHSSGGDPIALKTIRPDIQASERDIKLFLRESQVLQSLTHPQIIRFIEVGQDQGQLYFAMEYVPFRNAAQLLAERGPLPIPLAVTIASQVLEALEHAHAQRYVHRDIKPENVLVNDDGSDVQTKLADFGLARIYQASRMSGITMQGDAGGSLAFAPPEHLTNYRNATPVGDLYSVGAMLYTLLTGTLIYDFPDSVAKAVLMVLQSDPVPITERRPDLPSRLVDTINKSLQREPASRFETAAEMRAALVGWT
ncbi:FHA domain-containing serine/threonine-protein kinase [Fuerstiella marisgermanici]|uniref:Serine/threonine-protein kinase StkP n=1 Tax=Fuerstiella marisgermanici TaxID=1891926 RepID=A0A1P8WP43_9PLAN|nr:FHA domain-containing serine/threonine-protein kinase [Fuerstiella marisgermanici]APZ95832.1 Serine/threonine-protein kinase StkP [Fuerstiella marisgermanici]